jgi:hypothetical protein
LTADALAVPGSVKGIDDMGTINVARIPSGQPPLGGIAIGLGNDLLHKPSRFLEKGMNKNILRTTAILNTGT